MAGAGTPYRAKTRQAAVRTQRRDENAPAFTGASCLQERLNAELRENCSKVSLTRRTGSWDPDA